MELLKERIAVLETKIDTLEKHNLKIEEKVDQMYDVIMQLKGAKWITWVFFVSLGFVASNIGEFINFLQGKTT